MANTDIEVRTSKGIAISFFYCRGRIHIHKAVITTLQSPQYIRLLIHREKKLVIVQPCNEKERDAIKISSRRENKHSSVFINSVALLTSITELMGWSKQQTYRVNGEYLPHEHIIVFALEEASVLKEEKGESSC